MATLDVVNQQNEKVGSVDLSDAVFGGRIRTGLIWEAVVQENASERRGTHATKNRALVSGSGRKPWKQKGTGRARVGEIRNPLWRKGGTVFGPQVRSYAYELPRKAKRAALQAALAQKLQDGSIVVIDALAVTEVKTKPVAAMLQRFGGGAGTLIIETAVSDALRKSTRNIAGLMVAPANRVTARDVMNTKRVIVTRAALERLQATLGGEQQ